MIIDNRNEEDVSRYRYFDYDGVPIRTVYEPGNSFAKTADTVDPESGRLIERAELVLATETNPDADEITKDDFFALCVDLVQKKSP